MGVRFPHGSPLAIILHRDHLREREGSQTLGQIRSAGRVQSTWRNRLPGVTARLPFGRCRGPRLPVGFACRCCRIRPEPPPAQCPGGIASRRAPNAWADFAGGIESAMRGRHRAWNARRTSRATQTPRLRSLRQPARFTESQGLGNTDWGTRGLVAGPCC